MILEYAPALFEELLYPLLQLLFLWLGKEGDPLWLGIGICVTFAFLCTCAFLVYGAGTQSTEPAKGDIEGVGLLIMGFILCIVVGLIFVAVYLLSIVLMLFMALAIPGAFIVLMSAILDLGLSKGLHYEDMLDKPCS